MAATNSIKVYAPDSFYHLYNRGIEKRAIFQDEQDFSVFVSYLKSYLLPKDIDSLKKVLASPGSTPKEKTKAARLLRLNNFAEEIELHSFALLPNHFHLLIRQSKPDAIDRFVNSLGTRYSKYFNTKNNRVGKLYQGVYKAVIVHTDEQLLHLSRYIHLNPFNWLNLPVRQFQEIPFPSSLPNYLNIRQEPWIKTTLILDFFPKTAPHRSYLKFLEDYADPELITPIALDYTEGLN